LFFWGGAGSGVIGLFFVCFETAEFVSCFALLCFASFETCCRIVFLVSVSFWSSFCEMEKQVSLEDPAQRRILSLDDGLLMKNIEEILEVHLDLRGSNLFVRGSQEDIERAETAIKELVATKGSVQIAPGGKLMRHLFADFASELQRVESKFKVSVKVNKGSGEVVVVGTSKGVSDAIQFLKEKIEEVEDKSVEINSIDAEILPALIGKNGARINRLEKETGLQIKLEGQKALLTGPNAKLSRGKEVIEMEIERIRRENVVIEVDEDRIGALVINDTTPLKEIEKANSGVSISLRKRRVFVRGTEEGVAKACESIKALIYSQKHDSIDVPPAIRPAVIGRGGSVISKIQAESGCLIAFRGDQTELQGTMEQIAAAKRLIGDIISKHKNENISMMVLASGVGPFIGRKGANLAKLQKETGCSINLEGNSSSKLDEDEFGIIPSVRKLRIHCEDREKLEACADTIKTILKGSIVGEEKLRERHVDVSSSEALGKVIGRGGETIKAIQDEFEVVVQIDRGENRVVVRGKAGPNLIAAANKVKDLLNEGTIVQEQVGNLTKEALSELCDETRKWRFEDDTGARIEVNVEEKSALIEGNSTAVREAKARLTEIVKGFDRMLVRLFPNHIKALREELRTNLELLESKQDVKITLILETGTVRIVGIPKNTTNARRDLYRLLRFSFPQEIVNFGLVSASLFPVVLGKKGVIAKQIEKAHGVRITLDRGSASVYIVGETHEAVKAAVEQIAGIVSSWLSKNKTIAVPSECIPSIIGKKGASIKAIRSDTGLESIEIAQSDSSIHLRGNEEALEKATNRIEEIIHKFSKEHVSINIAPNDIPLLIGNKGSTIKSIEQSCSVRLRVVRESGTMAISGTEEAVTKALIEIDNTLAQGREEKAKKQEEVLRKKRNEEQRIKEAQEAHQKKLEAEEGDGRVHAKLETMLGGNAHTNAPSPVNGIGTPVEGIENSSAKKTSDSSSLSAQDVMKMLLGGGKKEIERSESPSAILPPAESEPVPIVNPPPGFSGNAWDESQADSDGAAVYHQGSGYSVRLN